MQFKTSKATGYEGRSLSGLEMILTLIFEPEVFVVFGATFILVVDTIVVLSHLEQLQQSLIYYVVSSLQLVDSLSRGGR